MTWQDCKEIVRIADTTLQRCVAEQWNEEEYYSNILREFNEKKSKEL